VVYYKAVKLPTEKIKIILTATEMGVLAKQVEMIAEELREATRGSREAAVGVLYCVERQMDTLLRIAASRRMIQTAVPAITAYVTLEIMTRLQLSVATGGL